MKNLRIPAIRDLVSNHRIATQGELRMHLEQQGIAVTQATLSRDIKEMGLVKRFDEQGNQRYYLPEEQGPQIANYDRLARILRDSLVNMQAAQHLVVIRTLPGHAHAVASQFDSLGWFDLIGTLAGDDTLLLIAKDCEHAAILVDRVQKMLE